MARLHLDLLGGFDCRSSAGQPIRFQARKSRALLAYLSMQAGRHASREKLASLLWGDRSEEQARADLRKTLSRLFSAMPMDTRDCLAVDARGIAARPEAVDLDTIRFERLAADGTPESLERAAMLHRGELLAGLDGCGEEFEAWLLTERRRLEETHHQILRRLLDHYVVCGAIDRAIQVALRLLSLDPLQESVHGTLMRLYMHQDRVGAALAQYRSCRDMLARELGVGPSLETERLRAELLKLVPGPTHLSARSMMCPNGAPFCARARSSGRGAGPS